MIRTLVRFPGGSRPAQWWRRVRAERGRNVWTRMMIAGYRALLGRAPESPQDKRCRIRYNTELARIKIEDGKEVPFGQQILVAYSWIAAPEKQPRVGFTIHKNPPSTVMKTARDSWKQALESLPRPPTMNDLDDGPGTAKSPLRRRRREWGQAKPREARKRKAASPPSKFSVWTPVLAFVDGH
ncbi:hypothetical protein THAOC_17931 [Thalassiosira oceanica]|uniref:Uncharacterized protein n=1 Tax=Thalassiosira oceanica TaxID=159749 RepID=K0SKR8_THAOC|nr:hypothetical protein THAOC_17931 [Thalassiosira oceanica]|eukprot:EJK61561.1 hypothetical protein THAOC_17931 [Thalassiosira oceanica]